VFPPALVDEVIAEVGRTDQRHRSLPARVMAYFAIGMGLCFARSGASRRSIVAADIRHNAAAVSSSMFSSPKARRIGTSSPRNGAMPLPEAVPITAQQNRRTTITSSP